MLSKKQINYALSLKTYDTFFDDVADVTVHIAHDDDGMYFVVLAPDGGVHPGLSTFLPYLWVGAANARLWPRNGHAPVSYFTQVRVKKDGDRFYTEKGPCTVKDDGRVGWKTDIRSVPDFMFDF
tara:strand:- start:648 stop:1019 length:372 start_codon:yes stop_codon:yes gene_type:complete